MEEQEIPINSKDNVKETINFCGKSESNKYIHFYKEKSAVKFCGHCNIFRVSIRETSLTNDNVYWSWWDSNEEDFKFTHHIKQGVSMCFPYGIEVMERNLEGKLLPVTIETI